MPWHMRGLAGQGLSTVVSLAYHLLSSASVELDLRTSYTIAISVSHTGPPSTKLYCIVGSNQIYCGTDMGDRDQLVIDSWLPIEQYADLYHHRYIHLKGI